MNKRFEFPSALYIQYFQPGNVLKISEETDKLYEAVQFFNLKISPLF